MVREVLWKFIYSDGSLTKGLVAVKTFIEGLLGGGLIGVLHEYEHRTYFFILCGKIELFSLKNTVDR